MNFEVLIEKINKLVMWHNALGWQRLFLLLKISNIAPTQLIQMECWVLTWKIFVHVNMQVLVIVKNNNMYWVRPELSYHGDWKTEKYFGNVIT